MARQVVAEKRHSSIFTSLICTAQHKVYRLERGARVRTGPCCRDGPRLLKVPAFGHLLLLQAICARAQPTLLECTPWLARPSPRVVSHREQTSWPWFFVPMRTGLVAMHPGHPGSPGQCSALMQP